MSLPISIEDCMHKNPATVGARASIGEAIALIQSLKITGLTVVDEDKKVLGVISELDCLRAVLGAVYNEGIGDGGRVEEFMVKDVEFCTPDEDITSVAQDMLKNNRRRRPVVKDGKLVGQLSCRNILWAIMEYTNRRTG